MVRRPSAPMAPDTLRCVFFRGKSWISIVVRAGFPTLVSFNMIPVAPTSVPGWRFRPIRVTCMSLLPKYSFALVGSHTFRTCSLKATKYFNGYSFADGCPPTPPATPQSWRVCLPESRISSHSSAVSAHDIKTSKLPRGLGPQNLFATNHRADTAFPDGHKERF